jgi:hypothetical protein
MPLALKMLALILVAVAMALPLAHALELPGKLRLTKEQYLAIQRIYYPGFTIGGAAEPLGLLAVLILLFVTPTGGAASWLTAAAFAALLAMHATYWLLTHRVNNVWLSDMELKGAGARFFTADRLHRNKKRDPKDWTVLRARWEFSHLLRAGFGFLSFILLAAAIAR